MGLGLGLGLGLVGGRRLDLAAALGAEGGLREGRRRGAGGRGEPIDEEGAVPQADGNVAYVHSELRLVRARARARVRVRVRG